MTNREPRGKAAQTGKRAGRAARAETATSGDSIIQGMLPPRDVILRFIADHPEKASKRELAKAFGLKGESRVELKDLLRSLEEEGLVQKNRKSLIRPGALPPVTVIDITTRDKDG